MVLDGYSINYRRVNEIQSWCRTDQWTDLNGKDQKDYRQTYSSFFLVATHASRKAPVDSFRRSEIVDTPAFSNTVLRIA